MTKTFSPRSAAWLVASGFLAWAALSISNAADTRKHTSTTDRPTDIATALRAMGPHTSLGDESKALGRVVGAWDVEYADFLKDGTVTHRSGEFIVGWVLDGRAVQDLWIVDPSGAGKDREVYTTVYYFEPKSRVWHATFVDPESASVLSFTGGAAGSDRFVLETQNTNSKTTRWSLNDIRPDSFVWRDEQSSDGGMTWRLKSEYHMKRRGGPHLRSDLGAGPLGRWLLL
ncbi:MAG TPA: hypothetical protein VNO35_18645 [Steroidobacteraceae bacterium]|nr:hypothetical protein [Steroidobacteraceae bacterium]